MGADLLLLHVPFKIKCNRYTEKGEKRFRKELEKCKKAMLKMVPKIKPNEYKKSSLDEDYSLNNEKIDPKQLYSDVEIDIQEFFECLEYRDVTWITHNRETIFLTGGMSWGDDPTESYERFNKITRLPTKLLEAGKIFYK